MTKRSRRAVFYALLALFPLLGAAVILYAQGWRIDFVKWRAEKVGAIMIRPFPADAAIALDGKPIQNQASFLSQATTITGLLPGNYALSLSAPGYNDWKENVTVAPSLVTELQYAVLTPSAPSSISTSSASSFALTSGGAFLETYDGGIFSAGATTSIARGAVIAADPRASAFIYRTPGGIYEWYDEANATTTNLSAALARGGAGYNAARSYALSFALDPSNQNEVAVIDANHAWLIDASGAQPVAADLDRAPSGLVFGTPIAALQSLVAWTQFDAARNSSAMVLYDVGGKTLAGSSSTLPGRTIKLQWITNSLVGALESDGSLWTYDVNAQRFTRIASGVKQFAAAPDGSAVASLEHESLEIIPIGGAQTYHRLNLPNISAASDVIWYSDAEHLFVSYGDSVYFLDLADSSLTNFKAVAKGTDPLYSPSGNILYVINPSSKLEQFDYPS